MVNQETLISFINIINPVRDEARRWLLGAEARLLAAEATVAVCLDGTFGNVLDIFHLEHSNCIFYIKNMPSEPLKADYTYYM